MHVWLERRLFLKALSVNLSDKKLNYMSLIQSEALLQANKSFKTFFQVQLKPLPIEVVEMNWLASIY